MFYRDFRGLKCGDFLLHNSDLNADIAPSIWYEPSLEFGGVFWQDKLGHWVQTSTFETWYKERVCR